MRREEHNLTDEIQLIPAWSVVLAGTIFVGVQALMHLYLWGHRVHVPPLGFRIFWSFSSAGVLASFALMIGYVTRDARLRGMDVKLWTLIVVFMPGAIGLVVYFLLRQPSQTYCPRCTERVQSSFNFCPHCMFQLAPICGGCHHTVSITDNFCFNCGDPLSEESFLASGKSSSDYALE